MMKLSEKQLNEEKEWIGNVMHLIEKVTLLS